MLRSMMYVATLSGYRRRRTASAAWPSACSGASVYSSSASSAVMRPPSAARSSTLAIVTSSGYGGGGRHRRRLRGGAGPAGRPGLAHADEHAGDHQSPERQLDPVGGLAQQQPGAADAEDRHQ